MKNLLLVFLGGGLGSALRYWLSLVFIAKKTGFPTATFVANILGSLLIGILLALFIKNQEWTQDYKLLSAVGFCGGFTTMSSFSAENIQFLRDGNFGLFAIYVVLTILLCLLSTYLGFQFIKS
jgi:CrcB protein